MFLSVTVTAALAVVFVLVFVSSLWHSYSSATRRVSGSNYQSKEALVVDNSPDEDPYTSIRAIPSFDWKNENPIAIRPFKPRYHLTMGLENLTMNELIAVDKTYEGRIQLRRQILRDHPSTFDSRSGSEAAVYELYEWMVGIYLPQRFPTMYSLVGGEKGYHLTNRVTGESLPLRAGSAREALQTLGAHVDTDLLILLPSTDDDKYHLEAFVACFPSGFSTLKKLGLTLAAIHKPVPGYSAKLEKSMDRYFANMPVGKIVKRSNWSVTTNDVLYAESGNHLYSDGEEGTGKETRNETNDKTLDVRSPGIEEEIARQKARVNVHQCRLRCERQTLHRLPISGALVFGFKTYQYTLAEVKSEGSGEELANAIEGLGQGNAPEMEFYKRGVVWGEAVKEFLRS